MRRIVVSMVIMALGVMGSAATAFGVPPYVACGVGPGGAGATAIGAWEIWAQGDYAWQLEMTGFADAAAAAAIAADVYAKEDRNGDGWLCVMKQRLPNDASGFDTWLVSHDNTAKSR